MGLLDGKSAIVTGAGSGIGRAAARRFAAEGASVVLVSRRAAPLEALAAEIAAAGGTAIPCPGDVTDPAAAESAVALAVARFGGLDVAFDNAGDLGALGPAETLEVDAFRATLETNLVAAFACARAQLPALEARGDSLIFTGSFVGVTAGLAGMAPYAAAKAGLLGLTRVLAAEYGPRGVRVNALLPGGTDTPMGEAATATPEARAAVEGLHALKRLAAPEEIAGAALFLASGLSGFVTGTTLFADGGVSISRG